MTQMEPRKNRIDKKFETYYVAIHYGMFTSFHAADQFRRAMHTDPELPDNVILYSEVKGQ